jgi:outer membrane biosynthesis protein TonB
MKVAVQQEENRTRAAIGSFIFHAAMLAILFFYTFPQPEPVKEAQAIVLDWGGGGDNAAAGEPDKGQGNNPAPQGQQMEDPSSTKPVDNPATQPAKATPPPPAAKSEARADAPKNTPTSSDPDVAAIRQQEAKRQAQDEQNKKKQQEDEQRRIADEQRRQQQAAADEARRAQEELNKKKGKFGDNFGKPGASGTGQGNTGKPGNGGIPGGTGDNPFGKSNGSGGGTGGGVGTGTGASVGGGLGGRKVVQRGRVVDTSQKSGVVVIEVCVGTDGNVVSADYTQRGSTTSDSELRTKAITAARQFRFAASNADKECGTITFNFQLK